jgi:hypothetical protein
VRLPRNNGKDADTSDDDEEERDQRRTTGWSSNTLAMDEDDVEMK